ncbi:MAG: hypothetical protein AAFX85_17800 [Pseudomonadota bacterium]
MHKGALEQHGTDASPGIGAAAVRREAPTLMKVVGQSESTPPTDDDVVVELREAMVAVGWDPSRLDDDLAIILQETC